jgi:enoyl-CoA hydratase/carnithine racemase
VSDDLVLFERAGSAAIIRLNRESKLNALNRVIFDALTGHLDEIARDESCSVAILTGTGRAFCAGADIGEYWKGSGSAFREFQYRGRQLHDQIEKNPKPVIAAVNGFALGGGCETAMACTIRLATEDAKFGQPEVKLGVIPGAGGTQRLPRLVGKGLALQLILSGGTISAQEAYRIGLVNEIVPRAELIARAEAILKQINSNAPLAVKFSIEAVNRGSETSQAAGLVIESAFFAICAGTEDKKEGTSAFLEKRAAKFQGR